MRKFCELGENLYGGWAVRWDGNNTPAGVEPAGRWAAFGTKAEAKAWAKEVGFTDAVDPTKKGRAAVTKL